MSKTFSSFIAKTSNIPELLKKAAKKFNVAPAGIDFDILKVTTGVKPPNKTSLIPVNAKVKERLEDDKFIMHSKLEIKESYEINIRPRITNEQIKIAMDVSIDKYKTKATGLLKKESKFNSTSALYENLLAEVNKRKVRLGMLIGVRDKEMRKVIKQAVGVISENGRLTHDVKIPLAKWIAPIPTKNDKLVFHYNDKKTLDEAEGKIDYANRGYVKEVQKDDLVLEHIPSIKGTPGRGYDGVFLRIKMPRDNYKEALSIDEESIEVKEQPGGITQYFAKRGGFIQLTNRILKIGDELDLDNVNFKDTGNIVTDLNRNITIKTGGKGEDDDIGNNMKVETTNLEVAGNIGSNASIKAVNVTVNGQTHQSSNIECKNATINHLRGNLKCDSAEIESLEGGNVQARILKVKHLNGGKVTAKELHIGTLGPNNNIRAVSKVHIQEVEEGGENRILLAPNATKEDKLRIRRLLAEREDLVAKRGMVQRKYENVNSVISRNKKSALEIKEKIDSEIEAGRTPKKMFVDKYNSYTKDLKRGIDLKEHFDTISQKVKQKNTQISRVQSVALKALVTCEDTWKGFNRIVFKTLAPPQDYEYHPPENLYATQIKLKQKNEDDVNDGFSVIAEESEEKASNTNKNNTKEDK